MSKTTKIIAALGVVAGLGVAALPAFTYAVGVSGNVEVDVEIEPAIAMTITGNNDDGGYYNGGVAFTYTEVQDPTGNPSENKYYELDGSDYVLSEDTTVDGSKTYYTRSSNYASVDNSAPTGVTAIDGHPAATIAGTSSSYAKLLPSAEIEGNSTNGFRSTITVYTNNATGFQLSVKDADTTTALSNGTDTIPTGSGAVAAGTAKWNFDTTVVEGGTASAQTAVAMPSSEDSAVVIDAFASKTNGGRATIVDYNVSTKADQQTGVYSDVIIYTATTNN